MLGEVVRAVIDEVGLVESPDEHGNPSYNFRNHHATIASYDLLTFVSTRWAELLKQIKIQVPAWPPTKDADLKTYHKPARVDKKREFREPQLD